MNNKARNEALKVLVKHEIRSPINSLEDMCALCKAEGFAVLTYDEGREIVQKLNLERFLIRDVFSYNYQGSPIIFYNDHLELLKQLISLAHELGHHRLQHYAINLEGDEYLEDWKEIEANIFAYELILPGPIIHECQYSNSFLENTYPIKKIYDYYISQRDIEDFAVDESLENKLLKRFKNYIEQCKANQEKERREKEEKLKDSIINEKLKRDLQKRKLQNKLLALIIAIFFVIFTGMAYRFLTRSNLPDTNGLYQDQLESTGSDPTSLKNDPIPLPQEESPVAGWQKTEAEPKQQEQPESEPVTIPEPTPVSHPSIPSAPIQPEAASATEDIETMVYVTERGTVYHLSASCQYTKNNSSIRAITLSEAQEKGMRVCKVCTKKAVQ